MWFYLLACALYFLTVDLRLEIGIRPIIENGLGADKKNLPKRGLSLLHVKINLAPFSERHQAPLALHILVFDEYLFVIITDTFPAG